MPLKRVPTTTHQTKGVRIVRKGNKHIPIFYDKPAVVKARADFKRGLIPYIPKEELKGPIRLMTKWLYQRTGDWKDGQYKTTKPDTDNSIKLLKDEMTALKYWNDDAQVASEITEKFYSDVTGIFVRIESIQEERINT